jgi:hypothetical protein
MATLSGGSTVVSALVACLERKVGKNMQKLTVAAVLTLLVALVAVPAQPVLADSTNCTSTLTGIHDNVVVPENATCTLAGTVVQGNVKVLSNATLQANGANIRGNVEGDRSRQVLLQFATQVGGNFDVKAGPTSTTGTTGFDINVHIGGNAKIEGNLGRTFVDAAIVDGNLEIRNNVGNGFLEVEFNKVGGHLKVEENLVTAAGMSVHSNQVAKHIQVFRNTDPGPKQVIFNTAARSIKCSENTLPFVGGPNTASRTEGQCF